MNTNTPQVSLVGQSHQPANRTVDDIDVRPLSGIQRKVEIIELKQQQEPQDWVSSIRALTDPLNSEEAKNTVLRFGLATPQSRPLYMAAVGGRRRSDRWLVNYKRFSEDAENVRNRIQEKTSFFRDYNESLAPRLKTLEAAFNIWANQLAYVHPQPGTLLRLASPERSGYGGSYIFAEAAVRWGAVAHLLITRDDGRFVILFRGTSANPALYLDDRKRCRVEPTGIPADTDPLGVGYVAYLGVAKVIDRWVKKAESQGRGITFVGHSLGGALALRALHAHASNRHHPKAYVYSSAGLDIWTASLMTGKLARDDIFASWHEHDLVVKTGKFPPMKGLEFYSSRHDSFPTLREASYKKGESDRHLLPFLSLRAGWGLSCASRDKSAPSHHIASEIVRNAVRSNLVTAALAGIASGVIHLTRSRDAHMAGPGLLIGLPGRSRA